MRNGLWTKGMVVGIILLFIGASVVSGFHINSTNSSQPMNHGWLYVGGSGPGNYTTIQSAINAANPSDTIFVYSGTYYEHVVINKTIDLIGEDKNNTVINGEFTGSVIDIYSDWVFINGFTIQNSFSYSGYDAAVLVLYVNNITISNNIITDNSGTGVYLVSSENNYIEYNIIVNNTDCGIDIAFIGSNNNIVSHNTIFNNSWGGIRTWYSDNNKIIDNSIIDNNNDGIKLEYSSDTTIMDNAINNHHTGIFLDSSSNNNHLYHNNLLNNTQNAYDDGNNFWDNDYPSGGNYWSDYTGIDSDGDGIGDTPYNILGGSNQDHYPFMQTNGWLNEPPNPPTISGPTQGKIKVATNYNFTATDPDGDGIYYFIDWGDSTNSSWIGPYPSGEQIIKLHTWTKKGTYIIKAKTKDTSGAESDWGQLSVTMPYSYNLPFAQSNKLLNFFMIYINGTGKTSREIPEKNDEYKFLLIFEFINEEAELRWGIFGLPLWEWFPLIFNNVGPHRYKATWFWGDIQKIGDAYHIEGYCFGFAVANL